MMATHGEPTLLGSHPVTCLAGILSSILPCWLAV